MALKNREAKVIKTAKPVTATPIENPNKITAKKVFLKSIQTLNILI